MGIYLKMISTQWTCTFCAVIKTAFISGKNKILIVLDLSFNMIYCKLMFLHEKGSKTAHKHVWGH